MKKRNWLWENIDWIVPVAFMIAAFTWGVLLIVRNAHAETRLNIVTGEAETVPSGDWITQLNPVTGKASVQPQEAMVELNAVTGEAEWTSGHEPSFEE